MLLSCHTISDSISKMPIVDSLYQSAHQTSELLQALLVIGPNTLFVSSKHVKCHEVYLLASCQYLEDQPKKWTTFSVRLDTFSDSCMLHTLLYCRYAFPSPNIWSLLDSIPQIEWMQIHADSCRSRRQRCCLCLFSFPLHQIRMFSHKSCRVLCSR